MSLTEKEVKHVAKLARIRIPDGELAYYAGQINGILKWIEQLGEVNTDKVAPLNSVSDQPLPWREDKVTDGTIQEKILKNASGSQYGCFTVPKVLE